MSSNNKDFRRYMAKETYWWQMTEMAKEIVVRLSFDGSRLPDGDEVYFRTQRQLHFLHAFSNLQRDMMNLIKAEKQPEIVLSTKRLVYRWLISLIEDKAIPRLSMEVTDWLVNDGPESMYPPEWKENQYQHGRGRSVHGGWTIPRALYPRPKRTYMIKGSHCNKGSVQLLNLSRKDQPPRDTHPVEILTLRY